MARIVIIDAGLPSMSAACEYVMEALGIERLKNGKH